MQGSGVCRSPPARPRAPVGRSLLRTTTAAKRPAACDAEAGRSRRRGGAHPSPGSAMRYGGAESDGIASGVRAGACRERACGWPGTGGCGFADAAADSLRKQGSRVRHGRTIRGGGLVRAARGRSRRIPRARMAVVRQRAARGNSSVR